VLLVLATTVVEAATEPLPWYQMAESAISAATIESITRRMKKEGIVSRLLYCGKTTS